MTATAEGSPDADLAADLDADGPGITADAVVRRPGSRRSRRRRGRLVWLQALTTVVFAALVTGLAWAGYSATLRITGGSNPEVTDPAAPGYVAEVNPTPVDLVALVDDSGTLVSSLVVSSGDGGTGGTVVPMPRDMSVPGQTGLVPPVRVQDLLTLDQVFADGGEENLRSRVGEALTFGFTSVTRVGPAEMEALAALAGPITVTTPDNLLELQPDGEETVRYRAGEVTLQPDEVLDFLAFGGSNESVPNQELRHEAVWEALLGALAGADRAEVVRAGGGSGGGDGGPSFGEVLADLLAGEVRFDSVPLAEVPVPGTIYIVYAPDAEALPSFVVRTVPSPTAGVPGQRARVRVLNGTTDGDAVTGVVPLVVQAGGEVTLIGNAESFDVAATTVQWVAPEARAAAEAIARALGVTATRADEEAANVDVDVVVGGDRAT